MLKKLSVGILVIASSLSMNAFAQPPQQMSSGGGSVIVNQSGEALSVTKQFHKNEIAKAQVVANKATDPNLKNMANNIIAQHKDQLNKIELFAKKNNLSTNSNSPDVRALQKQGDNDVKALKDVGGKQMAAKWSVTENTAQQNADKMLPAHEDDSNPDVAQQVKNSHMLLRAQNEKFRAGNYR